MIPLWSIDSSIELIESLFRQVDWQLFGAYFFLLALLFSRHIFMSCSEPDRQN